MIQVHAADIHANFSKEFITKCKGSSCFLPLPIGSSEVRGLGEGQAAIDSAIDSAETCKTSSSAVQDDLNETPSSWLQHLIAFIRSVSRSGFSEFLCAP